MSFFSVRYVGCDYGKSDFRYSWLVFDPRRGHLKWNGTLTEEGGQNVGSTISVDAITDYHGVRAGTKVPFKKILFSSELKSQIILYLNSALNFLIRDFKIIANIFHPRKCEQ